MKYGIYKSKGGTTVMVSRDLLNDKLYYITDCTLFKTVQNRIIQKEFKKWLKKMDYKYIGGAV